MVALASFVISWIAQRQLNLNTDCQGLACMRRKRSQENSERKRKKRVKETSGKERTEDCKQQKELAVTCSARRKAPVS